MNVLLRTQPPRIAGTSLRKGRSAGGLSLVERVESV